MVKAALDSGAVSAPPLTRAPVGTAPVLSFAQERLWFLSQLEPDDASYNIPLSLRLQGALDVGALARALSEIVRRHEVLRTAIVGTSGRPLAVVREASPVVLTVRPLDEQAAGREALAEALRPFALEAELPLRAELLAVGEGEYRLLLTAHHIATDGWSFGVLYRELGALYGAFSRGEPSPLPELPIQYADYAAWQRGWLDGERFEAEIGYWRDRLSGAPRALDLPTDRPRPKVRSRQGAQLVFSLGAGVVEGVRALSRREAVTPFMTLFAAFATLLHRLSGQEDLLVGTPIAGRTRAETEDLIGFFVNMLVLRTELGPELPFCELLARVKETCLGAFAHQELPFEQLVLELEPDRDPSRSPLFQVSFTLQAEPLPLPSLPGLAVRRAAAEHTTAKYDLTLALFDGPGGMGGVLEYASDLFDAATVERLAGHYVTLVGGLVAAPESALYALPLLSEVERTTLVTTWNATGAPWPEEGTIHGLFEAQVSRDPEAVALVFEAREMTYGELERRANQLAHRLGALGVGLESRVGVSMERSPELVVAILGVLKAGGAWVPLDPGYPRERLGLMIEDSGIGVLLTQASVAERLPAHGAEVVYLDASLTAIGSEPETRPRVEVTGESAAYVIYTSGSTGRPKGVVVEHRGLGNVAEVQRRELGVGPGSRVLQLSSTSFDASVWETVMALLNGATLVLAPAEALVPGPALASTLARHGVTIVTVPPSLLALVPPAELPALSTVVVAGEACPEELVSRWAPGRRFWNAYGPTETTICATMGECFAGGGKPSIGRPIANTQVYVLDAHREPVPIGVAGELCVGGVGLARGYLGQPALTAERFVKSPFEPGAKLYRTGDLARWRADGTLEYLGRIDQQVKLRGFRIELGEIEAVLGQHPGVSGAVVVLREDTPEDRRLVAYMAPACIGVSELRGFLEARLPAHLVPSRFVVLDALPLTPNGKIDRSALPTPGGVASSEAPRVPPRGPIEEGLAGIFAEARGLAASEVGAHDGFFALGGHSLLASAAVSRIRAVFSVELPLRALFDAPSPAQLAVVVQAALESGAASPPPLARAAAGTAPVLSFAQERLWFLSQLEPDDASYNIPLSLRLEGALDVGALERALTEIVRRHEVLRTAIVGAAGRPVAVVQEASPVVLAVRELDEEGAAREAEAEALCPFALETGRPIRAQLLAVGEGVYRLLLTAHHIASDGWSFGVLYRELGALYGAFSRGEASPLAELPIQYADYAAWQRGWLDGERFEAELGYWRERLAGAPRALELPADRPRPKVRSRRGAHLVFTLDAGVVEGVRALSRRESVTPFMTLFAAYATLLHRLTGQEDVVVGTPIAGRTRSETEGLIGFFVNMLVLRTELHPELPFRALLARVKETCLGAFAHQEMPFEQLVRALDPERDPGRSPLFQVSFTLQAEPLPLPALPGLAVRRVAATTDSAKYDLALSLAEGPAGMTGGIEYATDLFDAATVARMIEHLRTLLDGIVADPRGRLGDLPLLDGGTLQRFLAGPLAVFPPRACLHELLEAQVGAHPRCGRRDLRGREPDLPGAAPACRAGGPRAARSRRGSRGPGRALRGAIAGADRRHRGHPARRRRLPAAGSRGAPGAAGVHARRRARAGPAHPDPPGGQRVRPRRSGGVPRRRLGGPRRRAAGARGGGAVPVEPRVRDLHVGLDGHAQGGDGHPPQRGAPLRRDRAALRLRRRGRVDALPLQRVRLLRVGDLGSAAPRRSARGRAALGEPRAGGLPCAPRGRAGDGVEPDAVRVPAARPRGRGGGRGEAERARARVGDHRRRGAGRGRPRGLLGATRRRATAAGQHVRHHRDHRARDPPGAAPRRPRAAVVERDRRADPGPGRAGARRAPAPGAGGGGG